MSLFEMVNVAYVGLINTFLKDAPYLLVDQIEIRAIRWAKVGEIKSGFSLENRSSFSGLVSWSTVLLEYEKFIA